MQQLAFIAFVSIAQLFLALQYYHHKWTHWSAKRSACSPIILCHANFSHSLASAASCTVLQATPSNQWLEGVACVTIMLPINLDTRRASVVRSLNAARLRFYTAASCIMAPIVRRTLCVGRIWRRYISRSCRYQLALALFIAKRIYSTQQNCK